MATESIMDKCNAHLSEGEFNELEKALTNEEVGAALRLSNNATAPGVDGIPFEFYKLLDILFRQGKAISLNLFDVLGFLTREYTDIEDHGMSDNCKFNAGWLCPIFKKGDRSLISNYRPVTLLNCDYKLMTKAYSL